VIYKGSCHCKKITFEVEAPAVIEADYCNCSVCSKSGFLHLIVPLSKFKLLSGRESLTTYKFNTGIAKHTFCKMCGIKPFYTLRSNPDGIDINVNCLDTKSRTLMERIGKSMHMKSHIKAKKYNKTRHVAEK